MVRKDVLNGKFHPSFILHLPHFTAFSQHSQQDYNKTQHLNQDIIFFETDLWLSNINSYNVKPTLLPMSFR